MITRIARRRPHRYLVALPLLLLAGCNIVGPLMYLLAPRQWRKPEFILTEGRLAVLIETARPEQDNPVFTNALCEKLEEIFAEKKEINAQVIAQKEIFALRQRHPDFRNWHLQRVGRELDADQVLYVRIDRLQAQVPDSPLLKPEIDFRLKVVDPDADGDEARLWPPPDERRGREVTYERQLKEIGDATVVDAEMAKLGRDVAWLIADPFYKVDLEERRQPEP
jgi:hypothetical protein